MPRPIINAMAKRFMGVITWMSQIHRPIRPDRQMLATFRHPSIPTFYPEISQISLRPVVVRRSQGGPACDRSRAMISGPHPAACRRSGDITTIDCVARACDEAGLLAREIGHQAGYLVGLADTPKRDQRLHHLAVAYGHIGSGWARLHVVDGNPAR